MRLLFKCLMLAAAVAVSCGCDASLLDPEASSAVDLAVSGETANCYIVSSSGTYKFQPVKGNSTDSVGAVASVEVLWESFGTSEIPEVGDLIKSVNYDDGYVVFSTSRNFKEGNAVIAAKDDSGNILWSWHIWLTDEPVSQRYKNNAGKMMDRNLGATSAVPGEVGTLGLMYQWGRKDPFIGSSSMEEHVVAKSSVRWPSYVKSSKETGNPIYATMNPMTFITGSTTDTMYPQYFDWNWQVRDRNLWNSDEKTIYDPCPPGWCVPKGDRKSNIWYRATSRYYFSASVRKSGLDMSAAFTSDTYLLEESQTVWYPFAGRRSSADGGLTRISYAGYYWTGNADDSKSTASTMMIDYSGDVDTIKEVDRAVALSVRCMQIR